MDAMLSEDDATVEELPVWLLEAGRERGFVTVDEVLDAIPEAGDEPEDWESTLTALREAGISLQEESEDAEILEEEVADGASPLHDLVRYYMQQISKTPLLTPEEEKELAWRVVHGQEAAKRLKEEPDLDDGTRAELERLVKDGEKAREHLIKANTRLVVSLAKRYVNMGLPFLDLIQEGNIGLIKATERFDPSMGNRFSTYASWWIRQSILRALSNRGHAIRLPVHKRDAIRRMKRMKQELYKTLGHEPSDEELAEALGISPRELAELQRLAIRTISLDQPVGEDEETTLGELIVDADAPTPFDVASLSQLREDVRAALESLNEREREVLYLRYGLDGGEMRTLQEVAEELHVTRERVRQIESRALRKMRSPRARRSLAGYAGGQVSTRVPERPRLRPHLAPTPQKPEEKEPPEDDEKKAESTSEPPPELKKLLMELTSRVRRRSSRSRRRRPRRGNEEPSA
ncbi:MAG: sigma-70 family RNA polymerase sigma factor [Anaerolineae bacterium]|nr:sigma-70 family RNA polymerase sigma factor [Anaerolineae bacterium]